MLGRGLGEDATNFQMNRLSGVMAAYNPQLEFAAAKAAQAKKPGFFSGFGFGDLVSAGTDLYSAYKSGGG